MRRLVAICFIAIAMTAMLFDSASGVVFFPYGSSSSDQSLARADDAFTTIPLMFDLPFFGKVFKEIHLSTNGIIYFGQGSNSFTPQAFPLNETRSVAAYWVDSDPREGGNVFYREVFDPDLLSSITNEIRSKFVNRASFRSSWAFIVTFNNVPRFGCRSNAIHPCHMVVNHQTILTSNGIDSFVIFLYDKLGYAYAQIGFNAGDGKRFFLVPNSNTPQISEYALKESNVGEKGKWMFAINGEISSACGASGLLEVFPKKVFYFGGQEVTITGPCFKQGKNAIDVMFGETKVSCSIIQSLKIVCIAPYVDTSGRIDLRLKHENISFTSFIISHDVSDEIVNNKKLDISGDDVDTIFNVVWNVSSNQNDQPKICGMQEDIVVDRSGNIVAIERYQIIIKPPNTGIYEYNPNKFAQRTAEQKNNRNTIRRIYLTVDRFVLQKIMIEAKVAFSCNNWHSSQPSATEMARLKDIASRRNPCQPTVPFNYPIRLSGNFEIDDTCQPSGKAWCDAYRPGAKGCYRSTNNPDNVTTQCCFNNNNQLLLGPIGGGALSMNDPSKSKVRHFVNEILPNVFCFKLEHMYAHYYEKRPSIDSRHYVPPVVIRANGDPHFITLDGTEYDFNPVGEFIYLQGPELMVQTRIAQFVDKTGKPKQASYFSAFAIKSPESDVIQIEMTASKSLDVKVGDVTLQSGTTDLGSIFINVINSSHVSVETSQGLKMEIQILNDMLHSIVMLEEELKGKVFGLIGNWDNNQENDFMLPNKTFIPRNSSNSDIHFKFGQHWSTTENTSKFNYPVGLSWKDFQNEAFIPIFDVPITDPRCNGNKNCLFDLHVTGDINVGLANIEIERNAKNVETMLQLTSETCLLNVNITYGKIDLKYNASDLRFVNYTITCQFGYRLLGKKEITCNKGKLSDDFPLQCISKNASNHLSNMNFIQFIFSLIGVLFMF